MSKETTEAKLNTAAESTPAAESTSKLSEGSASRGEANKTASDFRVRVARELAVERMMQQRSQQEIAERVGTSKSNISRMEGGAQNMTVDYIAEMAAALGREPYFVLREPKVEFGDSTVYSFKLYDEELMQFRLTRGLDLQAEILSVNEERRHLLPLELELTGDGLIHWLRHRTIPQNRELVGHILSALKLNYNDLKGIIDICMGLSLNDSYWTPRSSFSGTFSQYNLYENEFSHALSLIAYTGGTYQEKHFRTSPELTTGGMLRKAWRFKGSRGIWLYKGGTEGFANAGNEPYCEFYACQVAERMGLNAVHYDLERWKGILASKCRLFTDIDTAYIPIGRIVTTGGIGACLDYYKNLGEEFYQQLADMLVFDCIVMNEDRHYGNFGVLRDNHTGRIIAPAPVFDNGISLLCYAMKDDFKDLEKYVEGRSNPYGRDNEYFALSRRVMGPRQRAMLRRLISFRFEESDVSNLPTWRLRALEELIQERVRTLLAM